MAVFPDFMITALGENGNIKPFNPALVNPASYDLTLSANMKRVVTKKVIDPSNFSSNHPIMTEYEDIFLQKGQKYILTPGEFILASSVEYVKLTNSMTALTMLKSTPARSGIGHMYAGYIDPGFHGNITFELYSLVPVALEPGAPICQIVFMQTVAPVSVGYDQTGRYHEQTGPTPPRLGENNLISGIDPRDPNVMTIDTKDTPIGLYPMYGLQIMKNGWRRSKVQSMPKKTL